MPVHRQYLRAARRIIKTKPDIIHAHFAYPGGVAGIHLARRWNVPVVLTLHGDDVNVHPGQYPRLARALRFGVSHADNVIAVSEALADRTARLTGRRPIVAPLGINPRVFAPTPDRLEARRALGLPADRWIILHLGRLVEEKGIRDLLKAITLLNALKSLGLFVGAGPLADAVRSAPGCSVVGVQPNERVSLFMRAADVFVLPSYSEGMPTVLVEAGATGLPVVATAVGGIPELLAGERGWIVPARDANALAGAMRAVLGNPAEGAARAERLRRLVLDKYDVRKNAEHLLSMYESLISARQGPPPRSLQQSPASLHSSHTCAHSC
jgi:teichuronic acid biosynthesis glycosyltransferase TuaC